MAKRGRVLTLAADGYEELELWYPKLRLEEEGYETPILGLTSGTCVGKRGYPCTVDGTIDAFHAEDAMGVVIPGGKAPEALRSDPRVLALVRALHEAGKLVAAVCHGGWVLADAGIVGGHRITSYPGIKNDLVAAGANWVDERVVIDGNLVTSRFPRDLPAFGASIVRVLWEREMLFSRRYEPHAPV